MWSLPQHGTISSAIGGSSTLGATLDLIVENVRCFAGRHVAPLAPITVLVGENSSGKSTLVAMARVAWDAMSRWDLLDFNEEPFRLGAFDDIVNTTTANKCGSFAVGFRFPPRTLDRRPSSAKLTDDIEVRIVFTGRDAQPAVSEWTVKCGDYSVTHRANAARDDTEPLLRIQGPLTDLNFTARDLPMAPSVLAICRNWHFFRMRMTSEAKGIFGADQGKPAAKEDLEILELMLNSVDVALRGGRPYASAPIRTKPTRTYDPLTDKPSPEGGHVPMMLAKLVGAKPAASQGRDLMQALHEFGSAAGLFKSIKVKRMGGSDEKVAGSDASLPFQIRVSMDDGPPFNLVDVGYGVSQVLPILVDAMMNRQRMLLLQQPEVHLHPKAQAELGSFLGKLAAEHQSAPIIIETHSDYLLDRIRMDVRDKRGVTGKDVRILYCARSPDGVTITPISIDDYGNLVDVPKGYREFFLAEERRFLQG